MILSEAMIFLRAQLHFMKYEIRFLYTSIPDISPPPHHRRWCTFFQPVYLFPQKKRNKDCFQQSLLREICTSLVMKVCQIHQTKHQVHQTKSMYAKQNTKYAKKHQIRQKIHQIRQKIHQIRQKIPTMPKKTPTTPKNTNYAKKTPNTQKTPNMQKKHQILQKFSFTLFCREKFFVPNLRTLLVYFLQT